MLEQQETLLQSCFRGMHQEEGCNNKYLNSKHWRDNLALHFHLISLYYWSSTVCQYVAEAQWDDNQI